MVTFGTHARTPSISLAMGLGLLIGLGACIPGAKDHDDAMTVHRFVQEKFPFPAKNDSKLGPTIYFRPGVTQTDLIVYGVKTTADQNRVIDLTRQARAAGPKRPVQITFMDEEHFISHANGSERSNEKVLRLVTVKD